MTDIDYLKILIDEPFAVYLANREKYLSSHQLMDFIRCPRLYYLKKTGALTTDPNKTSFDLIFGSATHKLILEGRKEFDMCYAVGAPINERTGKEYTVCFLPADFCFGKDATRWRSFYNRQRKIRSLLAKC